MSPAVRIRQEADDDAQPVHRLLVEAFGGPAEADLVEALRVGGHVLEALVAEAEAEGEVIGHVLFTRLPILGPDTRLEAAALAPLAVTAEFRGQGIGAALVQAGLEACRGRGLDGVVVLGDPQYYGRFGFTAKAARRIEAPWSGPAFMALAFSSEVPLDGRAVYAAPFGPS